MKNKKFYNYTIYNENNKNERIVLHRFEAKNMSEACKLVTEWTKNNLTTGLNVYKNYMKKYNMMSRLIERRGGETFRIFYIHNNEQINLNIFKARSRNSAYKYYTKYCQDRGLTNCYYGTAFNVLHPIGKKQGPDGPFKATHGLLHSVFVDKDDKVLSKIGKAYENGVKNTKKDMIRDITSFVETGHKSTEWYNLGNHILDDLMYNIPILIKKCSSYPNGVKDFETWKNMLKDFLLHLRLHCYYCDHGSDEENREWATKEFMEKYPIPYYPGTYKVVDFKKLNVLVKKEWEYISKFLSKNLLKLWD